MKEEIGHGAGTCSLAALLTHLYVPVTLGSPSWFLGRSSSPLVHMYVLYTL